ncbi:ACP S-malonyltransferase [Aliikangiella sp. IMCC44653]
MSSTKFAMVFPGQGSQSIGMLADFMNEQVVIDTFSEASQVLGYNVTELVAQGPAEKLNETQITQPVLLTASVALWRLWQSQTEARPSYFAGHSLGEYSALVAAEVIDFRDALQLVEKRGEFMQKAVPAGTGKMAAIIGLDDLLVIEACEESAGEEVVSAVNFNSPGQVVIAGNVAAVETAMQKCKDKGAKRALPLAVSVPSHCALMKPAAESLQAALEEIAINTPQGQVINNVDVMIEQDADKIKAALVRQLYCPVRWTETVQMLATNEVTQLVECGPGNVLSGLAKRIDRSLIAHQLKDKESFNQVVGAVS